MPARALYDPMPCYPSIGGTVSTGWAALSAAVLTGTRRLDVIAIDGPAILGWDEAITALREHLANLGREMELLDMTRQMSDWPRIVEVTAPVKELQDDVDFATIAGGSLADLYDEIPAPEPSPGRLLVVYGPGAALVEHDVLCYLDLPKRYAEAAVVAGTARNLGQPPGGEPATTRRLFYIDWPLLDRHRDELVGRIDYWIDLQTPAEPTWITGDALRASLRQLSSRPFRTRPTFNTTSWGGHWGQETLGFNPEARNTALGYELIAPESGILLGRPDGPFVEIPFQLLVSLEPAGVLGPSVHDRFGTSFPIRFDYLDTAGGGSLSVHCHPREEDMLETFGWPYVQHETYYVMVGARDHVVYLGLREDADLEEFQRRAHEADDHGTPFDIEKFVQTFPADPHQLFLVPAGTPHGSGAGNVVLEVSATPYLYSLRFYDWLRRDADGMQRPVHVGHAFRNLNRDRRGAAVRAELVQQPREVDTGEGWCDELIGALPEMFFEVHRLQVARGVTAAQHTAERFCVLNLVEGDEATVTWNSGRHRLAYAETMVIPAAVGEYSITAGNSSDVRIVRAFVP